MSIANTPLYISRLSDLESSYDPPFFVEILRTLRILDHSLSQISAVAMAVFARENDHGAGLARDSAQVVSEPVFDVPRLVEAAC